LDDFVTDFERALKE
jgi:hypothetical protein